MAKEYKKEKRQFIYPQIPKTPTGITGLDEITSGGIPKGRPTLVCGEAGCGFQRECLWDWVSSCFLLSFFPRRIFSAL